MSGRWPRAWPAPFHLSGRAPAKRVSGGRLSTARGTSSVHGRRRPSFTGRVDDLCRRRNAHLRESRHCGTDRTLYIASRGNGEITGVDGDGEIRCCRATELVVSSRPTQGPGPSGSRSSARATCTCTRGSERSIRATWMREPRVEGQRRASAGAGGGARPAHAHARRSRTIHGSPGQRETRVRAFAWAITSLMAAAVWSWSTSLRPGHSGRLQSRSPFPVVSGARPWAARWGWAA